MNWRDLDIAVVGGDEREQEIARLAASAGATVRVFGFPLPGQPIPGVTVADTVKDALSDTDYLLLPIPGIDADGSIFAPAADEPIVIDETMLAIMAKPAHVILGTADERLRAAAGDAGVSLHEYESDQELMLLRAPAIVEGALKTAIESTRFTLDANRALVVGYGNIGARLAISLAAIGVRVTVVARNPVQRAAAYAAHLDVAPLAELSRHAAGARMIFSTVPAPVVSRDVLALLEPQSLVMDLAAPPGGVDLDGARELGHVAVWARGLGRRAPITVGASQWMGIRRTIEAIEGARSHA